MGGGRALCLLRNRVWVWQLLRDGVEQASSLPTTPPPVRNPGAGPAFATSECAFAIGDAYL